MMVRKQDEIQRCMDVYYGAFPAHPYSVNHKIILAVVDEVLKSIICYRGHTTGKTALPKIILEEKYTGFNNRLEKMQNALAKQEPAYKEAKKAVADAEDLLNWIFLRI